MAKIKVGINGVGRIGRTLIRQIFTSPSDQIEVTAVNNPGEPEIYAHLIKRDSVHGTFPANVNYTDKTLFINEQPVRFFTERDPSKIPGVRLELKLLSTPLESLNQKKTFQSTLETRSKKLFFVLQVHQILTTLL